MNRRQVMRDLGVLVLLLAACMLSCLLWAVLDRRQLGGDFARIMLALAASVAVCAAVGAGLYLPYRRINEPIYRREAIAVVGLTWMLAGVLGALPYILSGSLADQYDSWFGIACAGVFESVSGFSCTGSTVFLSPEDLPRALLWWRALTHWLGGMGIVVLFVAVLARTGSAAKFMFSAEVPGPLSESTRARAKDAALLLWKFYLAFSLAETVLLWAQGMTLFDALCHTFATMATGGFSTHNASVGHYQSLSIEITIIAFMVIASTNFNLYGSLLEGKWKSLLRNHELRVYYGLLGASVLLVALDLRLNQGGNYSFGGALRSAGFNVTSIMTTTGFGVGDFNEWPNFSRWLVTVLMFIGGSAGSTSGAIKIIRILLFVRIIRLEVERAFRPHVVRPLKVGGQVLDDDLRRSICSYIALHLSVALAGIVTLLVLHNDYFVSNPDESIDLETAISAVAATLNGVGPGLNMVGATANYAFFTGPAKLLLCLMMIFGRLEIIVILSLFMPSFWRRD